MRSIRTKLSSFEREVDPGLGTGGLPNAEGWAGARRHSSSRLMRGRDS